MINIHTENGRVSLEAGGSVSEILSEFLATMDSFFDAVEENYSKEVKQEYIKVIADWVTGLTYGVDIIENIFNVHKEDSYEKLFGSKDITTENGEQVNIDDNALELLKTMLLNKKENSNDDDEEDIDE